MKKTTGFILLLVAYIVLYPGLTQPMLSITGTVEKEALVDLGKDMILENPDTPAMVSSMVTLLVKEMRVEGSVEAYQRTRSILDTVTDLYKNGYPLVAFLIMLFSVVIPVLKGLAILSSQVLGNSSAGQGLRSFSSLISKWSMADVFVIGIFVAFLAANAVDNEGGLLSFDAQLGIGFYCFLAYCLLSILSSQLLSRK